MAHNTLFRELMDDDRMIGDIPMESKYLECPVCYVERPDSEYELLTCSHKICDRCMDKWVNCTPAHIWTAPCPLCRSPQELSPVFTPLPEYLPDAWVESYYPDTFSTTTPSVASDEETELISPRKNGQKRRNKPWRKYWDNHECLMDDVRLFQVSLQERYGDEEALRLWNMVYEHEFESMLTDLGCRFTVRLQRHF